MVPEHIVNLDLESFDRGYGNADLDHNQGKFAYG
jgi:hypothetical protein